MRIALVTANPESASRLDADEIAKSFEVALSSLSEWNALELHCLHRATTESLHEMLLERKPVVLYLVARGKERAAAGYGVLSLCASDGRTREVTARAFVEGLGQHRSLRWVILQPCDAASQAFGLLARYLADAGLTVVTTPVVPGRVQGALVARVVAAALRNAGADELANELNAFGRSSGLFQNGFVVYATERTSSDPGGNQPRADAPSPVRSAGSTSQAGTSPAPVRAQTQLERKRAAGEFDVFLCHNSADKPAVLHLATQLRELGILPWLDIWELPPGLPWQPLLEAQISRIRSAAVLVGAAGFGPWQEQEMYGFLSMFVQRRVPVIPVVLADATAAPSLPIFLRAMTWVDFREPQTRPLERLVWGVTGTRPNS